MKSILVSEISLGDRQRMTPSDGQMRELKRSITQDGLFHPIVLTEDHCPVAGFVRLTAVKELAAEGVSFRYDGQPVERGRIPFVYVKTIEERAILRAELEEALRRGDLTPAGRARAVARLHRLYMLESEGPWSQGDTVRRLKERNVLNLGTYAARGPISRTLIISRFADEPDVAAATTDSEAYRAAGERNEAALAALLGLRSLDLHSDTLPDKPIA